MAIVRFSTQKIDPNQDAIDIVQNTAADVGAGNVLEVRFDDAAFTSEEGRKRLLNALERIRNRIASGHIDWPVL